jgi:DNA-binding CsgD family transcriptional regulator/N-acetylneuraminic acid mutarotase
MSDSHNELSEREREILRLVATGASNKEIAQRLFISTNTVKVHLRNIFAKIGVASRTEAAMYAVKAGMVEDVNQAALNVLRLQEETLQATSQVMPAKGGISRKWMVVVGLLVIGLLGAIAVVISFLIPTGLEEQPQPQVTPLVFGWQELQPLSTARYGLAVAAYEGQIFAIAGMADQGVSGLVERFDLRTKSWQQLAEKPTPVYDVSAAVIGGKIFIPGGKLNSSEVTDILEIYDPLENVWKQGAPAPARLSAYSLVAFEGRLYVFGGWNGSEYQGGVFQYDPRNDQWGELPAMPTARAYTGAAIVGGKIHVLGGKNAQGVLAISEVYDPSSQETPWSESIALPTALYGMGMVSVSDIIYIVGGLTDTGQAFAPLAFAPSANNWAEFESPSDSLPVFPGLVSWEGWLYLFGGLKDEKPVTEAQNYQLIYRLGIPIIR